MDIEIEHVLQGASWRIRAWLASPLIDAGRVGWRAEPDLCPVAEWLFFELLNQTMPQDLVNVDAEWLIWRGRFLVTPPVLAIFVDLIDQAHCARDAWHTKEDRVSQQEALAALLRAEHLAAQRLLPERVSGNERCAYVDQAGQRCPALPTTPLIHGFHSFQATGLVLREECREFVGGLCEQHWPHIVVPREDWWDAPVTAGEHIEARREEIAV